MALKWADLTKEDLQSLLEDAAVGINMIDLPLGRVLENRIKNYELLKGLSWTPEN